MGIKTVDNNAPKVKIINPSDAVASAMEKKLAIATILQAIVEGDVTDFVNTMNVFIKHFIISNVGNFKSSSEITNFLKYNLMNLIVLNVRKYGSSVYDTNEMKSLMPIIYRLHIIEEIFGEEDDPDEYEIKLTEFYSEGESIVMRGRIDECIYEVIISFDEENDKMYFH